MSLKVNWKDFDPERLVKTNIEKRTITPKPDPTKPNEVPKPIDEQWIPQMYRYLTTDVKGNKSEVIGELCVELPVITSSDGIKTEKGKGSSILCVFDQNKEDVKDFSEKFCVSYRNVLLERLFTCRGHMSSIAGAENTTEIKGSLKSLLYIPTDPNTNQPIAGKNPVKYFKLIDFGEGFKRRETQFTEPSIDSVTGKPKVIEWDILRNVKIGFIPLVKFKLYHRSKVMLEATIISAVVVSIEKSGMDNRQIDTCQQISQDKVIMESLERQLKNIRLAVKGGDLSSKEDKKNNSNDDTSSKSETKTAPDSSSSSSSSSNPPTVNPQSNVKIPGIPFTVPNINNLMAGGPNMITNK